MPGSYPRSANPYFPFDRVDQIEKELRRFHHLSYSHSFEHWALSTVFTSFLDAASVAERLNRSLSPSAGGRYIVVEANKTLLWCRKGADGQPTSEIISWSYPVASQGYIIVFVPDEEIVISIQTYKDKFGSIPLLLGINKTRANYLSRYIKNVKDPKDIRGSQHLPVINLPINTCMKCGEPLNQCYCN